MADEKVAIEETPMPCMGMMEMWGIVALESCVGNV
jgi:hypothetical protein